MAGIFDGTDPASLDDEALIEHIVGYAGQINALTARFCDLIAEFDERGTWCGAGMVSCASWLSWQIGMGLRSAQEHLRVGHAVRRLPRIHEAFHAGRLSFSKVRALTRVATPERDEELLKVALSASAGQLERVVSAMRQVDDAGPDGMAGLDLPIDPTITESTGSWLWNDDGTLQVRLELTAVDGAALLAALLRADYDRNRGPGDPDVPPIEPADEGVPSQAAAMPENPRGATDFWKRVPYDIGPAMVALAEAAVNGLAAPTVVSGGEVVVHEYLDDPADPERAPHLQDGPALDEAQVAQVACGGAIRRVGRSSDGAVLRMGRKRRPSAALIRAITLRDGCCRHPGCHRARYLHLHHVLPWSEGGETDPDNLILLCGEHHRRLHRGEFAVEIVGEQIFRFVDGRGEEIVEAPAVSAPAGWRPDDGVESPMTINGSPLDLDFTISVLYGVWEWQRRREEKERAAAVTAMAG